MMVYSGMFLVLPLLVVCTALADISAMLLPSSKRPPRNSTRTFRNYLVSFAYQLIHHLKHAAETTESASQQLLSSTPAHRKTRRHRRLAQSYRYLRYLAAGYALQTVSSHAHARSRRYYKRNIVTVTPNVWSYDSVVRSSSLILMISFFFASRLLATMMDSGTHRGLPPRPGRGLRGSWALTGSTRERIVPVVGSIGLNVFNITNFHPPQSTGNHVSYRHRSLSTNQGGSF
jgi:hypothetical protein